MDQHEFFMHEALLLAEEARLTGDVPVGCVIVHRGTIVGRGRNRREECRNALLHAEIEAIDSACRTLGQWRLEDCALYVTLEPCPMCAGAIINARIKTVYYGAKDPKGGAVGGVLNLFEENFNHKPAVYPGILKEECCGILQDFFRQKR